MSFAVGSTPTDESGQHVRTRLGTFFAFVFVSTNDDTKGRQELDDLPRQTHKIILGDEQNYEGAILPARDTCYLHHPSKARSAYCHYLHLSIFTLKPEYGGIWSTSPIVNNTRRARHSFDLADYKIPV